MTRTAMDSARELLKKSRNALWLSLPAVGRAEVSWRRRALLTRLWDLRFLDMLPATSASAIDVGANIGVYSSVLARKFTRVHAFEPNPSIRRRLAAASNGSITVWPTALSDAAGEALLHVPVTAGAEIGGLGSIEPRGAGVGFRTSSIQTVSLDTLCLPNISLIKIDVEGHELSVLKGAQRLLSSGTLRLLLVEAEDRHLVAATGSLFDFMKIYPFEGFFAYQGELQPISGFDAATHQQKSNADDPYSYSNVFLFIQKDDHVFKHLAEDAARSVISGTPRGKA